LSLTSSFIYSIRKAGGRHYLQPSAVSECGLTAEQIVGVHIPLRVVVRPLLYHMTDEQTMLTVATQWVAT